MPSFLFWEPVLDFSFSFLLKSYNMGLLCLVSSVKYLKDPVEEEMDLGYHERKFCNHAHSLFALLGSLWCFPKVYVLKRHSPSLVLLTNGRTFRILDPGRGHWGCISAGDSETLAILCSFFAFSTSSVPYVHTTRVCAATGPKQWDQATMNPLSLRTQINVSSHK